MIKNFTTLLALLIIQGSALAQEIKGLVKDSNNNPVDFATVVLCSAADTTQVDYTITDTLGQFSFNTKELSGHLLHISCLGYHPQYLPAGGDMVVVLQQNTITIDEVTVKGSRPISKMTASGVQTQVAGTVLRDMGTGNDVLKRIPMVRGDDGVFEVFGRGAARVYINNREVRDPSELDNLNSVDIQDIEVISNPGARYDASVKAVININTVKKQGDGLSFNLRSSLYTWENQDYINQVNTNYRRAGLDLFANLYYSDITGFRRGDISQTTLVDTLWSQQSYINESYQSRKVNGALGLNYEFNDNHSIGVRYDYKATPLSRENISMISDVYANSVAFDNWNNQEYIRESYNPTSQVNAYYSGKVGKLSIDFNSDYLYSGFNTQGANYESSIYYGDREINSLNIVGNNLWATKLQLSYPILKGELSLGGEYVNVTRSDEYINDQLVDFSSKVDIAEQNLAIFVQYQVETKIGNFAAGLRYEDVDYEYLVDDARDRERSRQYGQWFPNLSYSHRFNNLSVMVNYSSKVIRPSYSNLSSNLFYANRFTIRKGNPYLHPSINHDISLTGTWKFIQTVVSYTHQKDAIVTWVERYEKDPKVSVETYRNISELPKLFAFVAVAPKFGLYRPNFSAGIQKYWHNYSKYGLDIDMSEPIFFVALDNTFELPNDFIINIDGIYTSTGYGPAVYSYDDNLRLNFGVTKSFFNRAFQVKLEVSDITNQSSANLITMPQTELVHLYHFDNREVALTLRYYFNSAKSKYKGSGAGAGAKSRL